MSQTGIKHSAIQRLGPGGHPAHFTGMEKNQIQVRAIAHFRPSKFAIGNNRKTTVFILAGYARGHAVSIYQVVPGKGKDPIYYYLGSVCKVVTHILDRQGP